MQLLDIGPLTQGGDDSRSHVTSGDLARRLFAACPTVGQDVRVLLRHPALPRVLVTMVEKSFRLEDRNVGAEPLGQRHLRLQGARGDPAALLHDNDGLLARIAHAGEPIAQGVTHRKLLGVVIHLRAAPHELRELPPDDMDYDQVVRWRRNDHPPAEKAQVRLRQRLLQLPEGKDLKPGLFKEEPRQCQHVVGRTLFKVEQQQVPDDRFILPNLDQMGQALLVARAARLDLECGVFVDGVLLEELRKKRVLRSRSPTLRDRGLGCARLAHLHGLPRPRSGAIVGRRPTGGLPREGVA
mmetsp:Transcript_33512/g.96208  ORF Transcript_33512/g.96208 Transcript_33512/m.96208 type:complete len:297 (+) Transcript_33512:246-1136(+)